MFTDFLIKHRCFGQFIDKKYSKIILKIEKINVQEKFRGKESCILEGEGGGGSVVKILQGFIKYSRSVY